MSTRQVSSGVASTPAPDASSVNSLVAESADAKSTDAQPTDAAAPPTTSEITQPAPEGTHAGPIESMRRLVFDHTSERWRPVWRGRIHGIAALLTIPAGVWLVLQTPPVLPRLAVAIYVFSLFALFATSACYHMFTRSPRVQTFARRLDHSMIYILIAGTYTPVCLLAMPPKVGVPFLVLIWGVATLGVGLKIAWRARRLGGALYIVIGWAVVLVFPWAYSGMGWAAITLFTIGGVVYTMGALLFYLKKPVLTPEVFGYHEVWHIFVVIAGAVQFAGVAVLAASSA